MCVPGQATERVDQVMMRVPGACWRSESGFCFLSVCSTVSTGLIPTFAPVCTQNILGQDTRYRLLFDAYANVS